MRIKKCRALKNLLKAMLRAIEDFTVCEKLPSLGLRIGVAQPKERKQTHNMKISLTNEQKVNVTLQPQTATGKPVAVEKVDWSVPAGDSTIEVAEDGLSADIISSDVPGTSQVLITADADLGEGVVEISATLEVEVIGARAESLGISVGVPTAKVVE